MKTTAGPVALARPKLRGTAEEFASRLFGTHVTRTNALETLAIASFVRGLSVPDVEATLAEALGDQPRSPSLRCRRSARPSRGLPGVGCPPAGQGQAGLPVAGRQLLPDAPRFPAEPVLAAWGITPWGITTSGKPAFIGLAPGTGESADAWTSFLPDLKDRGLGCPLLIISDGAPG